MSFVCLTIVLCGTGCPCINMFHKTKAESLFLEYLSRDGIMVDAFLCLEKCWTNLYASEGNNVKPHKEYVLADQFNFFRDVVARLVDREEAKFIICPNSAKTVGLCW